MFARAPHRNSLNPSKEQEYDEDQNDEAETPARVVTPAGTVRPCRQGAERNQEQNHNEYGNHVCIRPLSPRRSEVGSGGFQPPPAH